MSLSLVLCILALLGAGMWLKRMLQSDTHTQTENNNRKSAYYFRTFELSDIDSQGRLQFKLNGERLNYHPQDDSTEIIQPYMQFENEQAHWRVQADRALAAGEALDEIHLQGAVDIQHRAMLTQWRMKTHDLLIKPKAQHLSTHKPAELIGKNQHIEAAGGLNADLQAGLITLSAVKARYVPTH